MCAVATNGCTKREAVQRHVHAAVRACVRKECGAKRRAAVLGAKAANAFCAVQEQVL